MTDVNEEIVKAYYETQGYLVKTNHYYIKKGKHGGGGHSDIDLIIYHPIKKESAIVSVKGWHTTIVQESNLEKKWEKQHYEKLKIDSQTIKAAKSFFGNKTFRKILVLSNFKEGYREKLSRKLEKFYGYDEVTDFSTILKELIEGNEKKGIPEFNIKRDYKDSEFLQTLRIMKRYYIKSGKIK